MKKKISKILILAFGFTITLFAEPSSKFSDYDSSKNLDKINTFQMKNNDSFNYSAVSVTPLALAPGFSYGHREKFDNNGIDFSGNISTNVLLSGISARCSYLKYFESNYYVGVGGDVGIGFVTYIPVSAGLSPIATIGKESEKNFHQFHISPLAFTNHGIVVSPGICYEYGFKF